MSGMCVEKNQGQILENVNTNTILSSLPLWETIPSLSLAVIVTPIYSLVRTFQVVS